MAFDIARGIFCSINYTLLWSIISISLISQTYSGPCRFTVFDFVITTPLKLPVHVYGAFTEIRGKGKNISHILNATLWHACKNLFMMSHSKKVSAFSVFKGKKVIVCIQFKGIIECMKCLTFYAPGLLHCTSRETVTGKSPNHSATIDSMLTYRHQVWFS